MFINDIILQINKEFPSLKIKFKDQSLFMKILGFLLFFNKDFMTSFTTTVGTTIYYPSEDYMKNKPITSFVILLHELIHVIDFNKNKLLFIFLYLFPQILALLALPALFVSWKIAILFLLFLLPLPSYFRMKYERKAYAVSLYVIHKLSLKKNFKAELSVQKDNYISYFKNNDYYYMWIFNSIDSNFNDYLSNIERGDRPFEDPSFDIIDKYIDLA